MNRVAAGGIALSVPPTPTLLRAPGYPMIDAHAHMGIWPGAAPNAITTPEELVAVCGRHGFAKTIISHAAASLFDSETGNAEVIQAARSYPDRVMAAVSFPSPYQPGILQSVEQYAAQGVRVLGELHFEKYSDSVAIRILRRATELGMLILIHCDEPSEAVAAATALPKAQIIVAHFGAGGGGSNSLFAWTNTLEAVRPHQNLHLDTSGSLADRGVVEETVNALGPERVIFGTDFPILDVRVMLAKVYDARISEDARRLIMGENIARLLNSIKRRGQDA